MFSCCCVAQWSCGAVHVPVLLCGAVVVGDFALALTLCIQLCTSRFGALLLRYYCNVACGKGAAARYDLYGEGDLATVGVCVRVCMVVLC